MKKYALAIAFCTIPFSQAIAAAKIVQLSFHNNIKVSEIRAIDNYGDTFILSGQNIPVTLTSGRAYDFNVQVFPEGKCNVTANLKEGKNYKVVVRPHKSLNSNCEVKVVEQ